MRVLLMLRGAPGCGKSTWIREHGLEDYALSADKIRMMCASPIMTVDGDYAISQANDTTVWKTLFQILEFRMKNGEFTVIDATNSKTSEMNRYKALCDSYKYRMYCVDMTDLPVEICKERNMRRDPLKRVPEEAIDKMYSRFATQKIPSGVSVIKPNELDRIFMKKISLDSWDKIHVIGDIHGCHKALSEYLMMNEGIQDNEFYIFTGDFIDRGVENADVIRFLCSIYDKPNVLLLEGNHERWLWVWANDGVCPSKEFEMHTRLELEDAGIDKKDVRKLYRKIGQCAWFDYRGKEFFVTHAGISTLPECPTFVSTYQMIKGVGNYNDYESVAETWLRTTSDNCYQIHGHRNSKGLPVRENERCFNLEGRVEFGGCLRAVQLLPDGSFQTFEIQNTVTRPEEDMIQYNSEGGKEADIAQMIINLRNNKYISEKRYGNISSFNFTKTAFYDKVWDEQTTKARGLYLNIPKAKIVARAYDKFFNVNERPETKLDMLQFKLSFPADVYVKENGFLGIVSYNEEDDSLFVTTKSSPDGDFAEWLRDDMQKIIGDETMEKLKAYSKENNASVVFECVDIQRDPHVIEYPETRLYLLDIIYNEMPMRKLPYNELRAFAAELGLRCKEHAFTLESWQDFFDWYYTVTSDDYLYNGRNIDGFVIEGANGYMVKLKLAYYKFWKYMRSVAHETIRKGYIDPKKTAALTTPLANHFYGWIKKVRESAENRDEIPTDIITLRSLFLRSEDGAGFSDTI